MRSSGRVEGKGAERGTAGSHKTTTSTEVQIMIWLKKPLKKGLLSSDRLFLGLIHQRSMATG